MIARDAKPRLAKKARLKWDRHESRWMLLYPERGLVLDEVASAIVKLCDGERTVESIAGEIRAQCTGSIPDSVESDVVAFLEKLAARGLVVT